MPSARPHELIASAAALAEVEGMALDQLIPGCLQRNVAVIAGGVFNSRILADPGGTYGPTFISAQFTRRC